MEHIDHDPAYRAGAARNAAAARPHTRHTGTARSHSTEARSIIDVALAAEQLATTFYYTALTTPAVIGAWELGGGATDPNNLGTLPTGNFHHVRYLQAALDAEAKHAMLLGNAGARAHVKHFYFPANTFAGIGATQEPDSFLGVLDRIETTLVGLYIAAVNQLLQLRYSDLALLAAQITAVEGEHRMLGRIIAGLKPANNLTLEEVPFATAEQAVPVLRPFLTGQGFPAGATRPIAMPSASQVTRVVGKYGTRRVTRFL